MSKKINFTITLNVNGRHHFLDKSHRQDPEIVEKGMKPEIEKAGEAGQGNWDELIT